MHTDSFSLMHGGGSLSDRAATPDTFSIAHLQSLQQTNERLRALVAELLLKNQTLRWRLADHGSHGVLHTTSNEPDFPE